ncbi:unnamed protein product [Scytosiphon promiscuus]
MTDGDGNTSATPATQIATTVSAACAMAEADAEVQVSEAPLGPAVGVVRAAEGDQRRGLGCQDVGVRRGGHAERQSNHHAAQNEESPLSPLQQSPPSSPISPAFQDFGRYVRVSSGGGTEAASPSPEALGAEAFQVGANLRERVTEGGDRGTGRGSIGSADSSELDSVVREIEERQHQQRQQELEMEEAFASARIPGALRRRPLGPVRRSEELGDRSLASPSGRPDRPSPEPSPAAPTGTKEQATLKPQQSEPQTSATTTVVLSAPPAVHTPTTALAGLPVNQAPLSSRPSRGSGAAATGMAAALEDATTVRYSVGDAAVGGGLCGEKAGGRGVGGGEDGGLPGASVLKHRVRRQLFSEDSEAKPLVFCPFCGDGVLRPGGLQGHLQECYVLDRCRGGETHKQVEVAIKAVSVGTMRQLEQDTETGVSVPTSNTPLHDDVASPQQGFPRAPFLSHTVENVPENVLASAPVPEASRLETSGGGVDECLGTEELSGKGMEVSFGGESGEALERCVDCGRTFAPGRLQSHAKACRSVFLERRRPYDPKAMRARGTPLEFFQQPIVTTVFEGDGGGRGGDGSTASASRRGGNKPSPASRGGTDGDRVPSGRPGVSVGAARPGRGGEEGGAGNASKKTALRALPAVKGSAHCPFCSDSVPRAKLSVHLLRCKNIRSGSQSIRRGEAASTRSRGGDSSATTPTTADSDNTDGCKNNSGAVGRTNLRGAPRKVQCPHCLRGFSPSVAPTHISICSRVENRPKGAVGVGTSRKDAKLTGVRTSPPDPASSGIVGPRRMPQEKARVMPPFY